MKNIHKKNKYISLIMTIIILFTTVLNNADNIFGADGVKLTITVVDAKGEAVNDAMFSSNKKIVSVDDTNKENGVYKLSVTDLVGKIEITDESAKVKVSVEYDANEALDYNAVLKAEWGFNIENDNNATIDAGKYNISTYYSENGEYRLYPNIDSPDNWVNTEFEVLQEKNPCYDKLCNDSECSEGSNVITDVDFVTDDFGKYCNIKYTSLGKSKIIIKSASKYYENIEIDFNVKNNVKFDNDYIS